MTRSSLISIHHAMSSFSYFVFFLMCSSSSLERIIITTMEKSPVHSEVANLRNIFLFNQSSREMATSQVDFILTKHDEFPYIYFLINHSSQGILTIRTEIDRDELCRLRRCRCDTWCDLELEILMNRAEFHVELLIVRVLDRNDHRPDFVSGNDRLNVTIVENAPIGSEIKLEPAFDYDQGENGIQGYTLVSARPLPFSVRYDVSRSDLSLVVETSLDRETISFYEFDVEAFDGGNQTGRQAVRVNIADVNDSPPTFDQSISILKNISEHLSIDSIVFRLHAHDNDTGVNSELTYSLLNDEPCFVVDPLTGDVRLRCLLDYEMKSNYRLYFEVRDQGEGSKTDFCTVIIDLIDENDHSPLIEIYPTDLMMINGSLVVSISEHLPINSLLFSFSIIDYDSGDNARVSWNLDPLSHLPFTLIRLTDYTGLLRSSEELDRESQAEYELILHATDHGRPRPKSTRLPIRVILLDENDHPPRFVEQNIQSIISERVQFQSSDGYEVFQFHANDLDRGLNGEIDYSLVDSADAHRFHLDNRTGILRATEAFDRQVKDQVHLTVRAQDKGYPPLYSETNITFHIIPKNEFVPMCQTMDDIQSWSVSENASLGFVIANISCYDNDTINPNSQLSAEIRWWPQENRSKQSVPFKLVLKNDSTLQSIEVSIVVTGPIDRETINLYPFVFIVKDHGNPSLIREFSSFIEVLDENDNCPKLKLEQPFLIVNRDLLTDYFVQLHAVDPDADGNGQVSFELSSASTKAELARIFPNGTLLVDVHSKSVKHEAFLTLDVQLRDHGQPSPCSTTESLRLFIGSNRTNLSHVYRLFDTLVKEEYSLTLTTVGSPMKNLRLHNYSSKYVFNLLPETKRKRFMLLFVLLSLLTSTLLMLLLFCFADWIQERWPKTNPLRKNETIIYRSPDVYSNGKRIASSSSKTCTTDDSSPSHHYTSLKCVKPLHISATSYSPCSSIESTIRSNPIEDQTIQCTYTYTAIGSHDDYVPIETDHLRKDSSISDVELMMTTV